MAWHSFITGRGVRAVANSVADVGRVFAGDKAAQQAQQAAAYQAALAQFGGEFSQPKRTWFDALVDGLNRLPRPALAFATIALFAYAMYEPVGFAARMQGLSQIPEQLWWILSAVIMFYFGARELHHARKVKPPSVEQTRKTLAAIREIETIGETPVSDNPAILAWRSSDG